MKRKSLSGNLTRLGWLLAGLLLPGRFVYAQTSSMSGVVKDARVETILGGATIGTVAGRVGSDVPQNAQFVVSCIRCSTQEIVVGSRSVVNIVLLEGVSALKLLTNYKSSIFINESIDSRKLYEGSIADVINHGVNNDCLKGWMSTHPEGFYDSTETKTLNQNLC
ncbi:MAG TPA: hypothetical protein VIN08_00445 [Ohtaekwangia sp.]|uniref:hypothetical protein n=1 Tax=Ohtaekwangia sp. TaxID=2066019 RepID=UPI002F92C2E6